MADEILALINNSTRLAPHRDYRVARGAIGATYLDLFSAPQTDVVAVLAERPSAFAATDDTLADLGLPERMKDCLIYYACWQLLSQRIPLGLEELKVTQRQTEDNDILESTTQGGTETQTQTDNKTQTEIAARDTTVTEAKTGTQAEVTDLEQTENKDEALTISGGETTTDVRTAATTTSFEDHEDKLTVNLNEKTETIDGTVEKAHALTDSGTIETETSSNRIDENIYHEQGDKKGVVEEERDLATTANWGNTTPATQTSGTESGTITTTTSLPETADKRDFTDHGKTVTETRDLSQTDFGQDREDRTTELTDNNRETVDGTQFGTKSETTSEDSQGTVTKDETQANLGTNLTVSSQEKTTTDDLSTETITDDDGTTTTSNTGTQVTALEKDTTQATATTGGKVTSVETVNTFRDRLQAAQYYKLLLDLEVQAKKMRPWVARGI